MRTEEFETVNIGVDEKASQTASDKKPSLASGIALRARFPFNAAIKSRLGCHGGTEGV